MKERNWTDAMGNVYNQQQWADADYPVRFANEDDLKAKIATAIGPNGFVRAFINAPKPATAAAQASATYDQTVRLSKLVLAIAKVMSDDFDDTTGT